MRRIARVLAVIWAGCWTRLVVAVLYFLHRFSYIDSPGPAPAPLLEWWLMLAFLVSVVWVRGILAWRWEAIGAIVAPMIGAVISVGGATKRVQQGQTIFVDGNKGIVYLKLQTVARLRRRA